MPAPVPPGYTRGPLLFVGSVVDGRIDPTVTMGQRQWLWREMGGFGARIVVITVESAHVATVAALCTQFAEWECDQLTDCVVVDRMAARNSVAVSAVEEATGIVLVGDAPWHWAATLGGTPLAQTIRRANARSKLVAGIGAVSAFLCQHIITPGRDTATLRGAVTFGPGLGLVNRLVVDANNPTIDHTDDAQRRLLAAVATNPFLIGVGLAAGSAAILYPDNALQASGPNTITVVDGQSVEAADLDAANLEAVVGAHHYTLQPGEGFSLDEHKFLPAGEVDLPSTGPVTSVF